MDNKNNRPKAREKNINTGDSAGVHRRGEKIGNQQVGTDSQAGKKPANKTAKRASIGGGSLLVIILAVLFTNLFSGGGTDTSDNTDYDDTSISESSFLPLAASSSLSNASKESTDTAFG